MELIMISYPFCLLIRGEIFLHAANNPRDHTRKTIHENARTRENDVYGRSHDSSEEEPSSDWRRIENVCGESRESIIRRD